MIVSLFGGCASDKAESDNSDGIFNSGTYEGTGEGYAGEITAIVEVSDDEILSIDFKEHGETEDIAAPAFDNLPKEIIENQSVAVDAVSGCTLSSNGILEAVKNALLAAGASEDDITKAVDKEDLSGELIEKSADVIIIGTGGAGMSAGAEVVKAGGSAILIDKMSTVGGNTIVAASAMNAANPELQTAEDMRESSLNVIKELIELEPKDELMEEWQNKIKEDIKKYEEEGATHLYDSPELHKLQTYVDGDYVGNPELIDTFGDKALDSVNWLKELGAKFEEKVTAAVGATWQRSHAPTRDLGSAGASFILPQQKIIEENDGEILLQYKAEEIIMEDGAAVGVKGTTEDGQPFELKANKGVVIATGGFAANPEMREKYNKHWPKAGADVPTTNPASSTGDGIVMAEDIGANLVGMEWLQMLTFTKSAITASIENSIQVNQSGERFVREDGRRDEICRAIQEQEGNYMYRIYDAHTIEDLLDGISYKGVPIDEYVGDGAYKADTLEELAADMEMDYETLQKTVDEFNESVDKGTDEFGRNMFDEKLDRGPYYAVKYGTMFHHTMGGIEINKDTQVLDSSGNVIPQLFAAGEVTGGIHGSNRLGGNAITDIVTFGRIAGQNVMK